MENMDKLMVSVIMLTYNRENLVSQAIECILKQTMQNFEFIIVNNGSSDNSGAVADDYAKKDARIRVIHREKGNIGSGRNVGLDAAKGEYITFIDDDDQCEPDFLEFLLNLALENNADVSICGENERVYDEKHIMTPEEALIQLFWRKRYNMAFPTKLFHKNLNKKIRFSETDIYDDIGMMYRLLAAANKVAYHGLPKYTFYRHKNNTSAWTTNHKLLTNKILDEYLNTYSKRTHWVSELFPENKETWRYFEWSFMISMVEKVNRLGIPNCEHQMEKMLNELKTHENEFMNCKHLQDFEKEWMEKYVL